MSELRGMRPARAPALHTGPGCFTRLVSLGIALLGMFYLVNPTAGLFEIIPDNLPIFGNLDEAGVTTAVLLALRTLFKRSK